MTYSGVPSTVAGAGGTTTVVTSTVVDHGNSGRTTRPRRKNNDNHHDDAAQGRRDPDPDASGARTTRVGVTRSRPPSGGPSAPASTSWPSTARSRRPGRRSWRPRRGRPRLQPLPSRQRAQPPQRERPASRRPSARCSAQAIEAALRAARLSDGAVDPTVGRAMRAVGYDRDFGRAISGAEPLVLRLEPVPGWQAVALDPVRRRVRAGAASSSISARPARRSRPTCRAAGSPRGDGSRRRARLARRRHRHRRRRRPTAAGGSWSPRTARRRPTPTARSSRSRPARSRPRARPSGAGDAASATSIT